MTGFLSAFHTVISLHLRGFEADRTNQRPGCLGCSMSPRGVLKQGPSSANLAPNPAATQLFVFSAWIEVFHSNSSATWSLVENCGWTSTHLPRAGPLWVCLYWGVRCHLEDPGKATEAPPSQKFRRELQEVAPCASRLYEAVARPGQLSRQVEEFLGFLEIFGIQILDLLYLVQVRRGDFWVEQMNAKLINQHFFICVAPL